MNIVYIVGFTGPDFVKRYCNGNERHLAATQKIKTICRALLTAGHQVEILSPGITTIGKMVSSFREEMKFSEGTVSVTYSSIIGYRGFSKVNNYRTYLLFKRKLKRNTYDLALFYNTTEATYLTLKAAKNKNIKTILEYEDHPLAHNAASIFNIKTKYNSWLLKKIFSLIHSVITVSKDLIPENYFKEVLLLPGALSDDIIFKAKENRIKASEPFQLVYTGGLTKDKGVDLLFSCVNYISSNVELHIIGNGPLRENLVNRQNVYDGKNKIIIHGYLNRDEMLNFMFNADILINPHLMNNDNSMVGKVFPFKMVEYCATGNPIVSSNVGKFNTKLDACLTLYNEDSPEQLAQKIDEVIMNYSEACIKAKDLQKEILLQYTLPGISQQLDSFIRK